MNAGRSRGTDRDLHDEVAVVEEGATSIGVRLRERHGLILMLLLAGYLLSGVDPDGWLGVVYALVWFLVLLATLWTPGLPDRLRRVGLTATVLAFIALIGLSLRSSDTTRASGLFLLAIAQAAALIAILVRISTHEQVTLQTVMGAVSAYALIALVMASVYDGADLLSGETFLDGVIDRGDYTYFSFVTLTTVGYGDITPASELAKRLVVVEAFVGQIFAITLVARLVSLWGKPLKLGDGR